VVATTPKSTPFLVGVAALLIVIAVAVRGIAPAKAVAPEDVHEDVKHIVEPMQFLGRGAKLRAGELDEWIAPPRRQRFKAIRELLFHVERCPPLLAWIDSIDGQQLERLIGELRGGTREESLAALTLTYQLARATEWKPGIMSSSSQAAAERLAGIVQDWLRTWGERGAKDPLLSEPAVATSLLYARLLRVAQRAPMLGTLDAPYKRARTFLNELLGAGQVKRTALGELMQARHGSAFECFLGSSDVLRGFDEDAQTLFPDIDGECGQ
jgi:hypothetical protein